MTKRTKLAIIEVATMSVAWGAGIASFILIMSGYGWTSVVSFAVSGGLGILGCLAYMKVWWSGEIEPWQVEEHEKERNQERS